MDVIYQGCLDGPPIVNGSDYGRDSGRRHLGAGRIRSSITPNMSVKLAAPGQVQAR